MQVSIWDAILGGSKYWVGSKNKNATIALGESLSGEIDTEEFLSGALLIPSAWTAAAVTFLVSDVTGGTFVPAKDEFGNEFTIGNISTGAAASYAIPSGVLVHRYAKIQSGVTGTTVNQAAARNLKLVLK